MATNKKRRSSAATARHARSLRKYTPEEREQKAEEHPAVEREHFEEVMRRLISASPAKKT